MPDEANPTFATWRLALENEFATLRDGAIVVGHSVGGTILINVLAECMPKVALGAIVLIAAPFIGEGGWTSADIEPASDLAARLPPAVPVFLYHGDKDDIAPIAQVALYADAIPRARVRRLANRDHQLNNNLAEVASDIRELVSR
jgi:pimeloyl-ACP methyl ester carboxylesterase